MINDLIDELSKTFEGIEKLKKFKINKADPKVVPTISLDIEKKIIYIANDKFENKAELKYLLAFIYKIIPFAGNEKKDDIYYQMAVNYKINNDLQQYISDDFKMINGAFVSNDFKDMEIDEIEIILRKKYSLDENGKINFN